MATRTEKLMIQVGSELREMTEPELLQYRKDAAEVAAREAEVAAKAAAREALLDRLGITAEEAQLLLGA